jgi:hypothetical protein
VAAHLHRALPRPDLPPPRRLQQNNINSNSASLYR